MPLSLASVLDCIGALLLITIAILGFWVAGTFFVNFLHQNYMTGKPFDFLSAGIIPWANFAIGLKVGASLFLIIFTLSVFCNDFKCKDKSCDLTETKKE